MFQSCCFGTIGKLDKFEKWLAAMREPNNFVKVFSFFYNNPHWPLFSESVKKAEDSIVIGANTVFLLTWFKRHRALTVSGTIAHSKLLLRTDPILGASFVKQTWIYGNFTNPGAERFYSEFSHILTPIEDAKRVKRLISQGKINQLIFMKKITNPQISNYITQWLHEIFTDKAAGWSAKDLNDPQKRSNIIQGLIDQKRCEKAFDILVMTNRNEELYQPIFFSLRRHVAYELLRSGKPKQAYQIMEMCKITPQKNNDNYVKGKWLLGYIAFRFLKDFDAAIEHFKIAYEHSKADIRLSKNAFWLAEVHRAKDDIVWAIDYYKKADEYFNTFYGYVAHQRLSNLPTGKFSVVDDVYENDIPIAPTDLEVRFYGRELVQTLLELAKQKKGRNYAKYFYKQLVMEIENPNEELLLLNLATANDELSILISTAARKQHFFPGKRAYPTLGAEDMRYIPNAEVGPCLLALTHSIILCESNFKEDAISRVGAVGLMQIMPATAAYEMKKINFYGGQNASRLKNAPLSDKEKNIMIGTKILSRLLKKYKKLVLAIAAYNCGEGNVAKFLKKIKKLEKLAELSCIDIIELIPFKETRIYVKHVIRALFAYASIFKVRDCYGCNDVADFL
ncbi:MAG: transglycosylase SLT domain-containing protein [Holosporales bacterium]|nr:transglycosylase SLT domain-containing protein [Holosporales bacterium]